MNYSDFSSGRLGFQPLTRLLLEMVLVDPVVEVESGATSRGRINGRCERAAPYLEVG